MEVVLEAQLLAQQSIEHALDNLTNLGKATWTRSTLLTRMADLKAAWTRFEDGHARLLASTSKDEQAALPYFADDPYFTTEETYLISLASMHEKLDQLQDSSMMGTT
ncbi:uncharacterized protein LOC143211444 [Lasioglossum baleicum]|uniref:uncharacterized protein LOC143211444 n=1 Tax=Lasioglossum baleicum TaxID=434251 RepID=UPI003FCD16EA